MLDQSPQQFVVVWPNPPMEKGLDEYLTVTFKTDSRVAKARLFSTLEDAMSTMKQAEEVVYYPNRTPYVQKVELAWRVVQ